MRCMTSDRSRSPSAANRKTGDNRAARASPFAKARRAAHRAGTMSTQFPVSAHVKTRGLVHFAHMVDKIRLHAAEEGRAPTPVFL